MDNLTTKQKIIIGAIISIVVVMIGVYGYNMLQQEENWEQDTVVNDESLQNEIMNQEGNTIVEGSQNTVVENKIVIHITGEVQKTGILVLPEGARIADAIDASRRRY